MLEGFRQLGFSRERVRDPDKLAALGLKLVNSVLPSSVSVFGKHTRFWDGKCRSDRRLDGNNSYDRASLPVYTPNVHHVPVLTFSFWAAGCGFSIFVCGTAAGLPDPAPRFSLTKNPSHPAPAMRSSRRLTSQGDGLAQSPVCKAFRTRMYGGGLLPN